MSGWEVAGLDFAFQNIVMIVGEVKSFIVRQASASVQDARLADVFAEVGDGPETLKGGANVGECQGFRQHLLGVARGEVWVLHISRR